MSNILEEYLVKIGATADIGSFNRAQNAVKGLTGSIEKLTFLLKAGGLAGLFAGITKAIKDQIVAVADLDMEYTKLASSMWVTKESGKALAELPKLMKAKPEDIAWIPELREQFFRLRKEMNEFATPNDAQEQLRWIRDIGYEVQSLQLKFMLFREWVVYYLIKYLGPYIEKIQAFLKQLNGALGQNMPQWANKVAFAIAKIVDVMASVFRLGKNIYGVVERFFTELPQRVKQMLPVFAAVGAALMMSPFGMFIAALGGALLLLEDFFFYLDGKKSSTMLAPMWEMLLRFMNSDSTQNVLSFLNEGLKTTLEILTSIVEGLKLPTFFDQAIKDVGRLAKGITDLASSLADLFSKLDVNKSSTLEFFKKLGEAILFPWRNILRLMGLLGDLLSAGAAAISGDYKKAAQIAKSGLSRAGGGMVDDLKSIVGLNNTKSRTYGRDEKADPSDIAREAAIQAKRVGEAKGVDPRIIYAQWYHESAGFSSQLATENRNLGGLTQSEPNGEDNKQPASDGNAYYKEYNSVAEYADDYMRSFLDYYPELKEAVAAGRTVDSDEFADILYENEYYVPIEGQTPAQAKAVYKAGLRNAASEYDEIMAQIVAEQQAATETGLVVAPAPETPAPTPPPADTPGFWDRLKGAWNGFISPTSYAAGNVPMGYAMVGGGFGGGVAAQNDMSNTWNIGNVTINTQATDGEGVRTAFMTGLPSFDSGASRGVTI